jgi:O-antigen ligase
VTEPVAGRVAWHRLELAALCGVALSLPFHLFTWGPGGQSVSPTEALILLTAALVGVRLARSVPYPSAPSPVRGEGGDPAPPRTKDGLGVGETSAFPAFDLPITLFLAGALLSLLATEYLRLSLRELRTLIVEPVLFWYLCRAILRDTRELGWLVGALTTTTTLVAVIGLVQVVVGGPAVTDVQGVRRVMGTYTSPNHFALLLGRSLPFLLAAAWCLPRWRRWAIVGTALCGGALLATFSVGGWIATGLAGLVVLGLLGGRRLLLGLIVAGALVGAVVFFAVPVARLQDRLNLSQGTSFVRVQLWGAGLDLAQTSPLLGIGLDNFLYRYPQALPPDTPFEPNLSHPHNVVLQFWLELGLAGLAALGWLLWRFGRLTLPRAASSKLGANERVLAVGALGSMTDFLVHGFVDNSYFLPDMAVIFWLTLAVAAIQNRSSD